VTASVRRVFPRKLSSARKTSETTASRGHANSQTGSARWNCLECCRVITCIKSAIFPQAAATTNGDNGVLFAAKLPFKSRCCTPHDARVGRLFSRNEGRGAALLIADFGDLRMMSAYFPGGKLKAAFFEVCAAQAEASTSVIP
jgi:hypothetical protein